MTDPIKEDLTRIDAGFRVLIDHIFHDGKPIDDRVAMVDQIYMLFMGLVEGFGYTRKEILMEACLNHLGAVR